MLPFIMNVLEVLPSLYKEKVSPDVNQSLLLSMPRVTEEEEEEVEVPRFIGPEDQKRKNPTNP